MNTIMRFVKRRFQEGIITRRQLPILMAGLLTPELDEEIMSERDQDPFSFKEQKNIYFGPSAKWLLACVLKSLSLSRTDEIAILTTSNATYVTTCVSVTSFNYARISRLVTNSTKVVIVIHEFGYVDPDILKKIEAWRRSGIQIIEDCAHIIGYEFGGLKVGELGDYGIFSLPKMLPVQSGGILLTGKKILLPELSAESFIFMRNDQKTAERYLTKYCYFNRARSKRFQIIRQGIEDTKSIYEPSALAIPYFIGIRTRQKTAITRNLSWVEWGATLQPDLLYLPTNPLVGDGTYKALAGDINYQLNISRICSS